MTKTNKNILVSVKNFAVHLAQKKKGIITVNKQGMYDIGQECFFEKGKLALYDGKHCIAEITKHFGEVDFKFLTKKPICFLTNITADCINMQAKGSLYIDASIKAEQNLSISAKSIYIKSGELICRKQLDIKTESFTQETKARIYVQDSFRLLSKTIQLNGQLISEKNSFLRAESLILGKKHGGATNLVFNGKYYCHVAYCQFQGKTQLHLNSKKTNKKYGFLLINYLKLVKIQHFISTITK